MKRVWLALAALVLTAVCAGARIAGDRDSAVAADNGTALPDREEIKYVALTFDDGPSPRCTPQLLDGLKERGVRATFFVVGCQVVKDPDIVIRMAAEGHQVGNHSYDHKELDKLSCGEAAEDMQRNNDLLCQLLGEGDYWVRPPYGLLSQEEMAALTVPSSTGRWTRRTGKARTRRKFWTSSTGMPGTGISSCSTTGISTRWTRRCGRWIICSSRGIGSSRWRSCWR